MVIDTFSLRDSSLIREFIPGLDPSQEVETSKQNLFPGLNSTGSITRGVQAGNQQNLALQAKMHLELEGKLNENTSIKAQIHDENIPAQSEGYTQQLQEFDRVYMEINNPNFKIGAGDLSWNNTRANLATYRKKTTGLLISTQNEQSSWETEFGAGLSRGSYAINQFLGEEGNQGPYRLTGNAGELFIIIISGTERVFIDGVELQRGADRDYVIDYNAAEITFTSNQYISKDKRISVEFQYAQQNYARFLYGGGARYRHAKGFTAINYLGESEAKNQTLQQSLSPEDRLLLNSSGDQIASQSSINPAQEESPVKYMLVDSLGFTNVLVYTTADDDSLYTASFSYLGPGKGNYTRDFNVGTAQVFKWLAPINGIPQGDYEPIEVLIPAKFKSQLIIQNEYQLSQSLTSYLEYARTVEDLNKFSALDDADNAAQAFQFRLDQRLNASQNWSITAWHQEKNFNPFEDRFDNEYLRNWQINDSLLTNQSTELKAFYNWQQDSLNELQLSSEALFIGSKMGLQQSLNAKKKIKQFNLAYIGSYLSNNILGKQNYYKHDAKLTYEVNAHQLYLNNLFEEKHGSLESNVFTIAQNFQINQSELGHILNWEEGFSQLFLRYRIDQQSNQGPLSLFSEAKEIGNKLNWESEIQQLKLSSLYRMVDYPDSNFQEQYLNSKIAYQRNFFDKQVQIGTELENSNGREIERIFSYLEVNPGQGQYSWIDFNQDGLQNIDEFVVPALLDTANYIRVFTPSTNFIRVNKASAKAFINLNPTYQSDQFLSHFRNRFSLSLSRRNRLNANELFTAWSNTGQAIGQQYLLFNQLSYNNLPSGLQVNYQHSQSKTAQLLAFDLEGTDQVSHLVQLNKSYSESSSIQFSQQFLNKENKSVFESRAFAIELIESELRNRTEIGAKSSLDISLSYATGREKQQGSELVRKAASIAFQTSAEAFGNLELQFSYVNNDLEGASNNLANFELLEGLNANNNLLWSLLLNKELREKLRMAIQYHGRTGTDGIIHTGNLSFSLFF